MVLPESNKEVAVVQWLSSWLAEQGVWVSNHGVATLISEIGYLLLPSRDMTEILLKGCKTLKTTQLNQTCEQWKLPILYVAQ